MVADNNPTPIKIVGVNALRIYFFADEELAHQYFLPEGGVWTGPGTAE